MVEKVTMRPKTGTNDNKKAFGAKIMPAIANLDVLVFTISFSH